MIGKSVLIIIDMQNELLHPEGKLYGQGFPAEFDRVVSNVQRLLAAGRRRGVPAILFTPPITPASLTHRLARPAGGAAL
jgi:nicotinamidase-related amidase